MRYVIDGVSKQMTESINAFLRQNLITLQHDKNDQSLTQTLLSIQFMEISYLISLKTLLFIMKQFFEHLPRTQKIVSKSIAKSTNPFYIGKPEN